MYFYMLLYLRKWDIRQKIGNAVLVSIDFFCARNYDIYIIFLAYSIIVESVDSISKDERGFPLTQYITNGRISRAG